MTVIIKYELNKGKKYFDVYWMKTLYCAVSAGELRRVPATDLSLFLCLCYVGKYVVPRILCVFYINSNK